MYSIRHTILNSLMLHAFFDFWFDVWAKFYQGRLKAYEQTKEINLYCLKAEFKVF